MTRLQEGRSLWHTLGHFTHETESPWPLHFKRSHWWQKAEPVQVHFTLRLRDQQSKWMRDGCIVYMDSHVASYGSCFMVTWIVLENHLLDIDRTQNRETMTLRTLTIIDLFYLIISEDPHEYKFTELAFGWGSVTTLHDFGGVLGRPLHTFSWALTISWSRLLARGWSGPLFPVRIRLWIHILICADAHRPLLSTSSNWHTQTWKMRCPCFYHCFWNSTVLCYPFWLLTKK